MRDVQPDTIIDDRYRVHERIGSGGMADVYVVEDMQLGRKVALKMLYRRFAADVEFVERFRREASSAAGLQHPNVVAVYDRGEWDGTYYIAMEYLDGSSLKDVVRANGPLDPETAIDITIQVLKAARFAHRRGIIHRDLKPHNVILDGEGRAKVTDFGIARAGASDMTETGSIMGTAQYLSPEQAQGHAVSAQSDIYSIGVMLYELLTGQVPFDADSAVTIALKQVSEAPSPPSLLNPAVWPALEEVVLTALQKDPAERFADAEQFIAALEHVQAGGGPAGLVTNGRSGEVDAIAAYESGIYPAAPLEPVAEDRSGWRMLLLVTLTVAVFALVLGGYLLLRPEKLAVPDVVGKSAEAASTIIANAGFQPNVEEVQSRTAAKGKVFRQDPQPDRKLKEGATITLYVSTGPGSTAVPPVESLRVDEARDAMTKAGFKVKVREEASADVEEGLVIETDPPAGQTLELGQTVQLVVSSGPRQVKVPSVVGRTLDEAERLLTDADLEVDIQQQETDSRQPDTVLAQDPEPDTTVDAGDTVKLTVAKEPAEPEDAFVPGVSGEDLDTAISALEDAGFRVRRSEVTTHNPDRDEIVQRQSPRGGTKHKKGSTVTVYVWTFELRDDPDPTPTPSPSPEPSPSPSPAASSSPTGAL